VSHDLTTRAKVRYLNPEWRTSDEAPSIGSRASRRANTSRWEVVIADARSLERDGPVAAGFGLDSSGFTLRSVDLADDARIPTGTEPGAKRAPAAYVDAMLDVVRTASGADATYLFADLVRTEDRRDFNTAYARFVHCDYNARNLAAMSTNLLLRRGGEPKPGDAYAWYNTWQPFDNVVEQNALAVLDARSLGADDIIDYRYTGYDGGGGLVAAPVYNPDHRWYYYPEMTLDEVLLTKQLDGRPGVAAQCPHTSFVDETRPADTPPRRSIELRIMAVFRP
jgi:hypothetical protein